MINITLKPTLAEPIVAGHIGTVTDVIAGHVPFGLMNHRFSAADFQYGFEMASSNGVQSMGEAVLVNGYCYNQSTDKDAPNYYQTQSGKYFVTSGIFLIPKIARPTYILNEEFTTHCTIGHLYETLFAEIKKPFAFAGFFDFAQLHATAIAKSPFHNQNIFDNQAEYYPYPPLKLSDVNTFIIGAVADYSDTHLQSLLIQLEVVLYHNPFDQQKKITTHAHCVTLNQPIKHVHEVIPDVVDNTFHVFSDQSLLKSVKGEIFVIEAMHDFS